MATYRPSGSSTTSGYQRGRFMLAALIHVRVAGLKMLVSARPRFPVVVTPYPPAVMIRPSGSCTLPEQKMLDGALMVENDPAAGSKISVGSGVSQPSHSRSFPVFSSTECTLTMGQLSSDPHWPPDIEPGTTALEGAEAGPVPMLLVALTVKV